MSSERSKAPNPWRSRGYLPHFEKPGLIQSVTYRLADSLPREFLVRCNDELERFPESRRSVERDKRIIAYLDHGAGKCYLKDPRIAELVEESMLHFDGVRYRLLAWCVMPNHVHVVLETQDGFPLNKVMHSWKSYTAKVANRILERSGGFWQREYHDRFIRDENHLLAALRYAEGNAVKAGLVLEARDWRWCSAWSGRSRRDAGAPSVDD